MGNINLFNRKPKTAAPRGLGAATKQTWKCPNLILKTKKERPLKSGLLAFVGRGFFYAMAFLQGGQNYGCHHYPDLVSPDSHFSPGFALFLSPRNSRVVEAVSKPVFSVTLSEAKGLKYLKIRDSSLRSE
jgi:hypothetical protein